MQHNTKSQQYAQSLKKKKKVLRVKLKQVFLPPKTKTRGQIKLWEMLDMSIILIVVDACSFAYVQTHKIEHIEYEQFSVSQSYFNKMLKKEILSKIMKCLTVEMYTKVVVIFL